MTAHVKCNDYFLHENNINNLRMDFTLGTCRTFTLAGDSSSMMLFSFQNNTERQ